PIAAVREGVAGLAGSFRELRVVLLAGDAAKGVDELVVERDVAGNPGIVGVGLARPNLDRLRGIGLHEGWRAFTRAPLLSLPVPPTLRNRIDGGAAARGGRFRVDARARPILRAAAEHDDDDVFGKVAVLSPQIPRRLVEIPQQRAADLRLD